MSLSQVALNEEAAVGFWPPWPERSERFEVHVKVISELYESGATGVHIHSGQHDQEKVIAFYGSEVLPRLRKGSSRKFGGRDDQVWWLNLHKRLSATVACR